jgi:hypothetical protein
MRDEDWIDEFVRALSNPWVQVGLGGALLGALMEYQEPIYTDEALAAAEEETAALLKRLSK